MESPVRILFASSEVVPFATYSEMGQVLRDLPELLQERSFESRIMMPRYGTISERRNRLHEVIRLSGCRITMGEEAQTLKVKVASIPGIRLQVYFMDSSTLFKRKGIYDNQKQGVSDENLMRAIFFARAVLKTTSNLGWSPDIVHAHGWMASLVPVFLRTEYSDHQLLNKARCVFSPDGFVSGLRINGSDLPALGLPRDERIPGLDLSAVAGLYADAVTVAGGLVGSMEGAVELGGSKEEMADQAAELYGRLLKADVPV